MDMYISLASANIVGPEGEVVAVELDKDLVECGRQQTPKYNERQNNSRRCTQFAGQSWPTLSVKTIPSWMSSVNPTGILGAFIPVAENEFAASEQLHKSCRDYAEYLQSLWWKSARLVFLPKNGELETPTFVMYGLSNPPMAREGDPRLDHWYEANLSIETHVLKLLAN